MATVTKPNDPLAEAEQARRGIAAAKVAALAAVTRAEAAVDGPDPRARLAARRALPELRDQAVAAELDDLDAQKAVAAAEIAAQRRRHDSLHADYCAAVRDVDQGYARMVAAVERLTRLYDQNAIGRFRFTPMAPVAMTREGLDQWRRIARGAGYLE